MSALDGLQAWCVSACLALILWSGAQRLEICSAWRCQNKEIGDMSQESVPMEAVLNRFDEQMRGTVSPCLAQMYTTQQRLTGTLVVETQTTAS